jgi:hypothetical protein
MNERIRELHSQCKVCDKDTLLYFDYEKFAQLIVRECMQVLDPGEHQLIARFHARKWLAEHFGVKE